MSYNKEKYFFYLLVNCISKSQKQKILKSISIGQYNILKKITRKIAEEEILISQDKYKKFCRSKPFIKKLLNKKVSGVTLANNYSIVVDIAKIIIDFYENTTEIHTSPKRKVGKVKFPIERSQRNKCNKTNRVREIESSCTESSSEEEEEEEEESRDLQIQKVITVQDKEEEKQESIFSNEEVSYSDEQNKSEEEEEE